MVPSGVPGKVFALDQSIPGTASLAPRSWLWEVRWHGMVKHSTTQLNEIAWSWKKIKPPASQRGIWAIQFFHGHIHGWRFWATPNIWDIDEIDDVWWYWIYVLIIWKNTSTFCFSSFDAFSCLTTLRHNGFSQSLAHGSDGTVLHPTAVTNDDLVKLMLGIGPILQRYVVEFPSLLSIWTPNWSVVYLENEYEIMIITIHGIQVNTKTAGYFACSRTRFTTTGHFTQLPFFNSMV